MSLYASLFLFCIAMSLVTFCFFLYKINRKWEEAFDTPGCLSGVCCILGVVFFFAGFVFMVSAIINLIA